MNPATVRSTNLTDRAMLVTVTIRQWSGAKTDKKASQEVADAHGSDVTMGHYAKKLLGKEALSELKRIAGEARQKHYFRTLPWTDDGYRILSSAGYFAYNQEVMALKAQFDAAVQAFLAGYPEYVKDAKLRLNGLFREADYPTLRELQGKFGFDVTVRPMPDESDFRVDLGAEETARVKADIQASVESTVQQAMRDVWQRVHDSISHMVERLKAYSVASDGKVSNPFRDTLVSNISELLDILPTLNLTHDGNLDAIAADIRSKIMAYTVAGQEFAVTPEVLRDSGVIRDRVAKQAEAILAQMEDFLA